MGNALEERREQPRDDLLSAFVALEPETNGLTEPEIINTCQTLLVAGHETTRSLIGNGLGLLLGDRAQWERLVDQTSLVRSAIEEVVRYESPVRGQPRLLKHDTSLGDVELREGDMLFQMLNGANRDPADFEHPDAFKIDREPNRHIGFGFGTHFCIGAPLARVEGENRAYGACPALPHVNPRRPSPSLGHLKGKLAATFTIAGHALASAAPR